jgi:hypothetical protein
MIIEINKYEPIESKIWPTGVYFAISNFNLPVDTIDSLKLRFGIGTCFEVLDEWCSQNIGERLDTYNIDHTTFNSYSWYHNFTTNIYCFRNYTDGVKFKLIWHNATI